MLNPIVFEHLKCVRQFEYQQAEENERREREEKRIRNEKIRAEKRANQLAIDAFLSLLAIAGLSALAMGAV